MYFCPVTLGEGGVGGGGKEREKVMHTVGILSVSVPRSAYYIYIYIWDSVQLNHPYGTFSKFPGQAKEK